MESKVISSHKELNGTACQMLLDSSECDIVYMTTKSCRWLSVRIKDDFVSEQQQKLIDDLNEIKSSYQTSQLTSFNAKILVSENPVGKQNDSIASFIQAGADVRYSKSNNTQRMILVKNQLYLSLPISDNKQSVVGKGILIQEADNIENPLIDYYKSAFISTFNKAKKLKECEGNIYFDQPSLIRLYQEFCEIETKDIILLIAGAILGSILSILV